MEFSCLELSILKYLKLPIFLILYMEFNYYFPCSVNTKDRISFINIIICSGVGHDSSLKQYPSSDKYQYCGRGFIIYDEKHKEYLSEIVPLMKEKLKLLPIEQRVTNDDEAIEKLKNGIYLSI
jgi:hypothetical protein